MDATLLAAAGLARLGLTHVPHVLLDPSDMPPAIGQGALAITARAGDEAVATAFGAIADPQTLLETMAERAFLTALDGSCRTAIGAYAAIQTDGSLTFIGEALSSDGRKRWRQQERLHNASVETAQALGWRLGLTLKAEAGSALLDVAT
jgi:hydroxymethylbilane synthase